MTPPPGATGRLQAEGRAGLPGLRRPQRRPRGQGQLALRDKVIYAPPCIFPL
jgi:hypothetical protein